MSIIQSIVCTRSRGLAALLIAAALLFAGSFSTDAQAALTKTQQLRKADGQAAFLCYAWQCNSTRRLSKRWYSAGNLIAKYRLRGLTNQYTCPSFAVMEIWVNLEGTIRTYRIGCG